SLNFIGKNMFFSPCLEHYKFAVFAAFTSIKLLSVVSDPARRTPLGQNPELGLHIFSPHAGFGAGQTILDINGHLTSPIELSRNLPIPYSSSGICAGDQVFFLSLLDFLKITYIRPALST
ncbi:MAG: hypothetical protein O7C66_00680, partial [Alphaproteobacteria bacterium]|nr:hypothetical protein [Alphaproteobacteria bacterium]